jgi:hypothetical protein
MNPIQFILGFSGYVKIPLEVVQLSIQQEKILQEITDCITDEKDRAVFQTHVKAQKVLTKFFRSGRLL